MPDERDRLDGSLDLEREARGGQPPVGSPARHAEHRGGSPERGALGEQAEDGAAVGR